jgi:hypothetical protein
MRYYLLTMDFSSPMYFIKHDGDGFKMSNENTEAVKITGLQQALAEARRLSKLSGMDVQVRRIKALVSF